jgi:hypothetical protein
MTLAQPIEEQTINPVVGVQCRNGIGIFPEEKTKNA